jgi:DNA-binding NarL/FixJ family response regulator
MCAVKYPRKVKTFVTLVNSAINRTDRKDPEKNPPGPRKAQKVPRRNTVIAKLLAKGCTNPVAVRLTTPATTLVASVAPVHPTAEIVRG